MLTAIFALWYYSHQTVDEGEKLRNGRTENRGRWEPGGYSADMKASEGVVKKLRHLSSSSLRRSASVIGRGV